MGAGCTCEVLLPSPMCKERGWGRKERSAGLFRQEESHTGPLSPAFFLPSQFMLATDKFHLGYCSDGHCHGVPNIALPPPTRLLWDIPAEVGCHPSPCMFF